MSSLYYQQECRQERALCLALAYDDAIATKLLRQIFKILEGTALYVLATENLARPT